MTVNANKLKLSFLLLISLVPIVAATLYFRWSLESGSNGTTSKGVLISPVLDLARLELRDEDGEPAYLTFEEMTAGVDPEDYEPRPWQVLFVTSAECRDACVERLYMLRQMHLRLASEATRVQRALVLVDGKGAKIPQTTLDVLAEQQPDLRLLNGDAATLKRELAPSAAGRDLIEENFIYLADPVGNIMLYFTPENTVDEIFRDIDKLLEQSGLG
jgi:hypothetical protein